MTPQLAFHTNEDWRVDTNGQTIKVGKTLAFTSISFRNEKNELVARGSHTKSVNFLLCTYPPPI